MRKSARKRLGFIKKKKTVRRFVGMGVGGESRGKQGERTSAEGGTTGRKTRAL